MAPKTGLKHNVVSTQNNEKPLLVFTSKAEDGVLLKKCYYGELTSIDQALDLDRKIRNEGIRGWSFRCLGGRGVSRWGFTPNGGVGFRSACK
ncbi:hypothetical protein Ancab_017027, partial [Ancistrocladus abbreviatus]